MQLRGEVKKPRGCATFVEDDEAFLWFCLVARDSGIAASQRANVKDGVDALAFDYAVTYRLYEYDLERDKSFSKYQAYQVMKMYVGNTDDD
jgi:hypothetical protein